MTELLAGLGALVGLMLAPYGIVLAIDVMHRVGSAVDDR